NEETNIPITHGAPAVTINDNASTFISETHDEFETEKPSLVTSRAFSAAARHATGVQETRLHPQQSCDKTRDHGDDDNTYNNTPFSQPSTTTTTTRRLRSATIHGWAEAVTPKPLQVASTALRTRQLIAVRA
ncbi:unnamed protein product, partial [Ectocarpus sp. 13 AM-2016]